MTELYADLGLTSAEYTRIKEIQGREPTHVELAVYSLMWSEHCGYKHSRPYLGRFPSTGARVLQGPGENAGIVDIGGGLAVAMKIESHNHPSAIEPYQGAATGVGGILRDIFAMGARPICSLDSLRFGEIAAAPRADADEGARGAAAGAGHDRQRYLFEHVVAGIGGYGNCMGIPTVAGEVYFEDAYSGNCLVNAMTVGLVRPENIVRSAAAGVGNHVVLFGSKTGRDGIGGASVLASQEFDETLEEKRPSVQVGDPFTEKKLLEVCLELLSDGRFVALQDLGAAGITSSASEMAAKGGVGIDIHTDRVPLRERDMAPWEIMISESQERMLAVVTPEDWAYVKAACDRWDLDCTVVGDVTGSTRLRVFHGGEVQGDMPAEELADAPTCTVTVERPAHEVDEPVDPASYAPAPAPLGEILLDLLGAPNIASRRWIWEQYDHQVQLNTVVLPGGDAALLRVKETGAGLAVCTDGNGRHTYLDPYRGAKAAVAEAARNVSCVGAEPIAVTNCLNFGNPEKGAISYQLSRAIEGMAEACEAFGVPVISGNVSLYNESFGQAIYPTPVVGMLGLSDDFSVHCTSGFAAEGDVVVLLGDAAPALDGSEYQKRWYGVVEGRIPDVDLEAEVLLQAVLRRAIGDGMVRSAHDCADGGLAVALAESCVAGGVGARLDLGGVATPAAAAPAPGAPVALDAAHATAGAASSAASSAVASAPTSPAARHDVALFGEAPTRVVVSVAPEAAAALLNLCAGAGVPVTTLGTVGGDTLRVRVGDDGLDIPVPALRDAHEGGIPRALGVG
ncbi:MAG TPA: phosphoribosylformylglycinamidine synthase subunit PurL [Thermoleophilia bacterium]|nr:phosphoribosylformylglycinamidine synthase subunit PurL [Thermoleophilia bacterium]